VTYFFFSFTFLLWIVIPAYFVQSIPFFVHGLEETYLFVLRPTLARLPHKVRGGSLNTSTSPALPLVPLLMTTSLLLFSAVRE